MRQVDGLWAWVEPQSNRIMLGNRAAADAAHATTSKGQSPRATGSSDAPAPLTRDALGSQLRDHEFQSVGNLQVSGGPVVSLRISSDHNIAPLRQILVGLATQAQCDLRFDYAIARDGRQRLWINGERLIDGRPDPVQSRQGLHSTPFVYLMFELLRRLFSHAQLLVLLHGSAVVWQGKTIVLAGASGSGKTTLAASLVGLQGAKYLADDIVVMAHPDRILPLPLAPSIKEGTWPLVERYFPQLADAQVFYKRTRPLKYLANAPYAEVGGAKDLLVFPIFSRTDEPKSVRLTRVETLLHLSRAGLWTTPDNLDPFLDMLAGVPAIALRHGPDLSQTHAMLDEQLRTSF